LLDWPDKSPDLNPVDNLWGILARKVYGHGKQYKNKQELIAAVIIAWSSIPIETLQTLIRSMKDRIFIVICRLGGYSK